MVVHDDLRNINANRAYTAYSAAVGGKAFNGDLLPNWQEFSNDSTKTKQSEAWKCAIDGIIKEQGRQNDTYHLFDSELSYRAGIAYNAYCKAVGGVAWNGDKLPDAVEFMNDETTRLQANGWRAVILALKDHVAGAQTRKGDTPA